MQKTLRSLIAAMAVLTCITAVPSCAAAHSVEERAGDIYFRSDGFMVRATNSGDNRDPSLSTDQKLIVFIRNVRSRGLEEIGDFLEPEFGASQLWIYDAERRGNPTLLLDSPIRVDSRYFFGFYGPEFSADGRSVYFQIAYSGSSPAIVRLALASGEVRRIGDALGFSVVRTGQYRSDLIAQQHRPKIAGGYYDWFYLLNEDGVQIGVIGDSKDDVYNFLQRYVGDVQGCLAWNGPNWLSCTSQLRE